MMSGELSFDWRVLLTVWIGHIEKKGWPPRGSSWGSYACAATVAGRVN